MLPLIPLILFPTLLSSAAGLVWYWRLSDEEKERHNEGLARIAILFARKTGWVPKDHSDDQVLAWLGNEGALHRQELRSAFQRVAQRMFRREPEKLTEEQARRVLEFIEAEAQSGRLLDAIA